MAPLWPCAVLALACLPAAAEALTLGLQTQPLTALGAAEVSAFVSGSVAFVAAFVLLASHAFRLPWPELQTCFLRIILFIPVVVIASMLIMMWGHQEYYFELITSFWLPVLFFALLETIQTVCGGRQEVVGHLEAAEGGLQRPGLASCFCEPFRDGEHALATYESEVALFCVLRPVCDIVRIILRDLSTSTVGVTVVNVVSAVLTVLALSSILTLQRRVLRRALPEAHSTAHFWAFKIFIVVFIIEQRVVETLADNYERNDNATQSIYRKLQILILWETLILAVPLAVYAYSVCFNKALQAASPVPSEPEVGGRLRFLWRAVFLAHLDCARFVARAVLRRAGLGAGKESAAPVPPSQMAFHSEAPMWEADVGQCALAPPPSEVSDGSANDTPQQVKPKRGADPPSRSAAPLTQV